MSQARRPEPLRHPGPATPHRRVSLATTTSPTHVVLRPGQSLLVALDDELRRLGRTSAQVSLLTGRFDRISYCFPAPSRDGSTAASYSETQHALAPARVIAGSATVGWRDDERFVHCHAVWHDGNGELRGGHLWPETLIGGEGMHALIYPLDAVEMICEVDTETRMPAFTPHPSLRSLDGAPSASHRAVASRVAPGVVLADAIRAVLIEHDCVRATIAGSLGSLVGATFHRGEDSYAVDGPATEVTIEGTVDLTRGPLAFDSLYGYAIDVHGKVTGGRIDAEHNVVAVTFELLAVESRVAEVVPHR